MFKKITAVAMIVALAGVASADIVFNTIIDPLTQAGDRGQFTTSMGQTFVTGTLTDNELSTIEVQAARDNLLTDVAYIAVYEDADGDASTWGLGSLVGVSTDSHALSTINGVVAWNFSNEVLSDSTTYVYTFTSDAAGTTLVGYRAAVESNANSAGAGNTVGHVAGQLFGNGALAYSSGYDIASTVTTIPEPGTLGLITAFGGAVLFIRRKMMI